jgi:NAD-reducing hydrogenase large subunit
VTLRLIVDQPVDGVGANVVVEFSPAGAVLDARLDLSILPRLEPLLLGRPVEQVPPLVERLCGVCPAAHHLAGVAALEALHGIGPIPAEARRIRRLLHYGSVLTMHATSFFAAGREDGLALRKLGKLAQAAAGSPGHFPASAVVGGVSGALVPDAAQACVDAAPAALTVARDLFGWALNVGPGGGSSGEATRGAGADHRGRGEAGAGSEPRADRIEQGTDLGGRADGWDGADGIGQGARSGGDTGRTGRRDGADGIGQQGFLGADVALVDADGRLDPLGARLRAVGPDGAVVVDGATADEWDELVAEERPGEAASRPYLLAGGPELGRYRVGPVAQLRVGEPATPVAAALRGDWLARGGGTLAARAVLAVNCVEAIAELAGGAGGRGALRAEAAEGLPPQAQGRVGVGWVDGARGLLAHRYRTDQEGAVDQALILTPTAQNEYWLSRLLVQAFAAEAGELALENAIREADPCLPCVAAPAGHMGVAVKTVVVED